MPQMPSDMITINPPTAPIIDVVMPSLKEGGISFGTFEVDNSIQNYYRNLQNTVKTSFTAFKTIVDTSAKLTEFRLKQEIGVAKGKRNMMINEAKRLGLMPDLVGDEFSADQIAEIIKEGYSKKPEEVTEKPEEVTEVEETTPTPLYSLYPRSRQTLREIMNPTIPYRYRVPNPWTYVLNPSLYYYGDK